MLTSTLETDAFGVETYRANPGIGIPSRSGFAGRWGCENEGGGLNLVGNRWYDADAGRFLTRDPARQGRNWWNYCDNDPVNYVDPEGTERRDMTAAERAKVLRMISDMYDRGDKEEAAALESMTRENRIRIQNGPDAKDNFGRSTRAQTEGDTIYLTDRTLADESDVSIEGTLIHERVHVQQNKQNAPMGILGLFIISPFTASLVGSALGVNDLEGDAYSAQEKFLRRRRAKAGIVERGDIDEELDRIKHVKKRAK